MSKQLLILGAGADRTAGIDFPLANTLLADVTQYLVGPGKPVDAALRDMLPGLENPGPGLTIQHFHFIGLLNPALIDPARFIRE